MIASPVRVNHEVNGGGLASAPVLSDAEAMAGPEALPRVDGEVSFAEPWQGRAVALAVETTARLGLHWDEFRTRLIAAIDEDPHRPYYDSFVIALERLIADKGLR